MVVRGSDLPGVTTAEMLSQLTEGYQEALGSAVGHRVRVIWRNPLATVVPSMWWTVQRDGMHRDLVSLTSSRFQVRVM
jgi:hypothetical protein